MTDSTQQPTPPASGDPFLRGEVISVDGTTLSVRLESGEVGSLICPPETAATGSLALGRRAMFRIAGRDAENGILLAFVRPEAPPSQPSFEREVDRLHLALSNHRPSSPQPIVRPNLLGEEQIQRWIQDVEGSLVRLRKHRAQRLDEEFYNG